MEIIKAYVTHFAHFEGVKGGRVGNLETAILCNSSFWKGKETKFLRFRLIIFRILITSSYGRVIYFIVCYIILCIVVFQWIRRKMLIFIWKRWRCACVMQLPFRGNCNICLWGFVDFYCTFIFIVDCPSLTCTFNYFIHRRKTWWTGQKGYSCAIYNYCVG